MSEHNKYITNLEQQSVYSEMDELDKYATNV